MTASERALEYHVPLLLLLLSVVAVAAAAVVVAIVVTVVAVAAEHGPRVGFLLPGTVALAAKTVS